VASDLSSEARQKAAQDGAAMPDGSYPTRDCEELKHAIQAYGRETGNRSDLKRYLIHRSVVLGCTEHIPDEWEVEVKQDGEASGTGR
jgi:hypothetical protein